MSFPRHQMMNGKCQKCGVSERLYLDVPCIPKPDYEPELDQEVPVARPAATRPGTDAS